MFFVLLLSDSDSVTVYQWISSASHHNMYELQHNNKPDLSDLIPHIFLTSCQAALSVPLCPLAAVCVCVCYSQFGLVSPQS